MLPDHIVELGATARRAFADLGGVDLARRAEADPRERASAGEALRALGGFDIDPLADADQALAAFVLCREAGRVALPYPVEATLCRVGGSPVVLVDPADPLVDHGDLLADMTSARLVAVDITGAVGTATVVGSGVGLAAGAVRGTGRAATRRHAGDGGRHRRRRDGRLGADVGHRARLRRRGRGPGGRARPRPPSVRSAASATSKPSSSRSPTRSSPRAAWPSSRCSRSGASPRSAPRRRVDALGVAPARGRRRAHRHAHRAATARSVGRRRGVRRVGAVAAGCRRTCDRPRRRIGSSTSLVTETRRDGFASLFPQGANRDVACEPTSRATTIHCATAR